MSLNETENAPNTRNNKRKHANAATINNAVSSLGYTKHDKLADSLQGEVFVASSRYRDSLLIDGFLRTLCPPETDATFVRKLTRQCGAYFEGLNEFVIKKCNKSLHRQRVTINEQGEKITVCEDIVKEAKLMKFFQHQQAPKEMIGYVDFFQDDEHYYLVMERGGKGLFEFVVECHQHLLNGTLCIKEWRKYVRFIFAKMVKVVHWMHNKANCCNLDISLENIVLCHNTRLETCTDGKVKARNLDIRFIDFGLTELFDLSSNPNFLCNKFVGKAGYKAPQVYNGEIFAANSADIWSMGCCLFSMTIGAPLFHKPSNKDAGFKLLQRGSHEVMHLLQNWGRLHYIGRNQFDLLMRILCVDETQRISIDEIMEHEWIQSYFPSRCKPSSITALSPTSRRVHHAEGNTKSVKRGGRKTGRPNKNALMQISPSIAASETFTVQVGENCAALD